MLITLIQQFQNDDNRVNNSTKQLDKTDKFIVKTMCDILHTDYDRTDTTTIVLFSMISLFLIIGVPLTIGGIIWLIVSKIKERRRRKKNIV